MEKKVVQVPVYETQVVEVGIKDKEIWITEDGSQFEDFYEASMHEDKLEIKETELEFPFDATLCYFTDASQVTQWLNRREFTTKKFNEDVYEYPNWYVIYDASPNQFETRYDMVHVDDFKEMVLNIIDRNMK